MDRHRQASLLYSFVWSLNSANEFNNTAHNRNGLLLLIRKVLAGTLPPIASQLPPSGPRNGGYGSDPLDSARFSDGYQLMPVGAVAAFDINSVEERLRQLEVRMTIAERSGRTVWDETMRTQTELRSAGNYRPTFR